MHLQTPYHQWISLPLSGHPPAFLDTFDDTRAGGSAKLLVRADLGFLWVVHLEVLSRASRMQWPHAPTLRTLGMGVPQALEEPYE
jgi:hypothetical protein